MRRWTRKTIIQELLQREVDGRSLSASRRGVDTTLYQAAKREYGSWREALVSAGIAPQRTMPSERWPPQKILNALRHLAKRKRPMTLAKVRKRYHGLVPAAQRVFGSWPSALVAAGVDPAKLRCVPRWTRDRVIEAILTRDLRNEPLGSRTTQPQSLVDAAQRFFGTWAAAKKAAGAGLLSTDMAPVNGEAQTDRLWPPDQKPPCLRPDHPPHPVPVHRPRERWTAELVQASICARLGRGQRLNATAVSHEDDRLYRAASRHFGTWHNALVAAGVNPQDLGCRVALPGI